MKKKPDQENFINEFTFLIITYNHGDWIIENLESIKFLIENSKRSIDIDLIISDDHSSDQTINYVKKWVSIRKNKRLFRNIKIDSGKQNLGIVKNYLKGLKLIDTIKFKVLAGDDVFGPNNIFDIEFSTSLLSTMVYELNHNNVKPSLSQFKNLKLNCMNPKNAIVMILRDKRIYAPGIFFQSIKLLNSDYFKYLNAYEVYEDFFSYYYFLVNHNERFTFSHKSYVIYRKKTNQEYADKVKAIDTIHRDRSMRDKRIMDEIVDSISQNGNKMIKNRNISNLFLITYFIPIFKYLIQTHKFKKHYNLIYNRKEVFFDTYFRK